MADNPGTNAINAVAEEVGKDLYATAKRQLNYFCCFSENIESMNEETENLRARRDGLEIEVEDKKRNLEIIDPQVNKWLADSEAMINKKDEIEGQIANARSSCCTNMKSRFSLGKKVKVTTEAMQNLLKKELPTSIAHPALHPARRTIQVEDIFALPSRKKIENDIVQKLSSQQEAVNVVGIAGMGGVGKTTLATDILNRMITKNSFEAVKVVVSQDVDILRIQKSIAFQLGFEKTEDWKDEDHGVRQLSSRLNESKKLLILLDDIWEELPLARLGIPKKGGCMTLLTSRYKGVLHQMHAQVFEINTLPKDEARSLFQEKAEIQMDGPYLDTDLKPTAEKIVEECNGLPLAIVIIGSALRKKEQQFWNVVLRQLERSRAINDVYEKLHMRLKISYDLLDNKDAKLLFLLCCLFPEDHSISINDLELYSMGLNIFNEVDSLREARDRVYLGVDKLKNCYLLLKGKNENEVKMHDVVRDVAINIASEEEWCANLGPKGQYHEKCKWISVCTTSRDEPLDHFIMGWSNFPDLRLLIIHHLSSGWDDTIEIGDISILQGMQGLNVLSFRQIEFGSPPEEIKWPNDLSTLQFVYCEGLKTLSFVGDLLKLKILDCNGCQEIQELPVEIGGLKCLKLLNLSRCRNLKRIAPGIIKQLGELEELKMFDSFDKWESSKDKKGVNVPLNELESLHKLICLEIKVNDVSLAHEKMDLSSNLVKYKIQISKGKLRGFGDYEKAMVVDGLPNESINDGSWIRKLIATTAIEELMLNGDGSGNWRNLSRTHKTLKSLEIMKCGMLKELVDSSTMSIDSGGIFPMLEYLYLHNLSDLKQVCGGQILEGSVSFSTLRKLYLHTLPSLIHLLRSAPNQQVSFNKLQQVQIWGCGKLQNLFLLGKAKDTFIQLETLEIRRCETMKQVFISEESDEDGKTSIMTFPKLKTLELDTLRSLTTFWKGSESSIEFPSLEKLDISGCEQLKSIVCSGMESDEDGKTRPAAVTFPKLKEFELDLTLWKGIESTEFPSLEKLKVRESEHDSGNGRHDGEDDKSPHFFFTDEIKFYGLKDLTLEYYSVNNIWCHLIPMGFFRRLERLRIAKCHNIRSLLSSLMVENIVNLNYLCIEECDRIEQVFKKEDDGKTSGMAFPKLETFKLDGLSSLTSLGEVFESIEFPQLKHLSIRGCPQLRSSVSVMEKNGKRADGFNHDDEFMPLFCDKKVKFSRLEILLVKGCHEILGLFSSSAAGNLTSLKSLNIKECDHMKKVITGVKEMHENSKLFPSLELLEIENMPLLEIICEWKHDFKLPVLTRTRISGCPQMKFPQVSASSHSKLIKALKLPHLPLLIPDKVARLLYMHSGAAVLALDSNVVHHLWTWQKNDDNPSGMSSTSVGPQGGALEYGHFFNQLPNKDFVACITLSKDDSYVIATSDKPGYSKLLTKPFRVSMVTGGDITAVTYLSLHSHDNGVVLAVGREDSTIQIYDVEELSHRLKTKLKGGHQRRISGLAFSLSLNILVSSGADAHLCLWSIDDGWKKTKSCLIQAPPGHPALLDGETRVQFHNNQSHLLVVHETQIAIYDAQFECLRSWYRTEPLSSPVSSATFSCDGQRIFTGFCDGTVGIFDFQGLTLHCRIAPSDYIPPHIPSNSNGFLMVIDIAAHPFDPYQFALSNGAVYVIELNDAETECEVSTPQENNILPSNPLMRSAMNNQPSETQSG